MKIKNEISALYSEIRDKKVSQYLQQFLDTVQVALSFENSSPNSPRNTSSLSVNISASVSSSKPSKETRIPDQTAPAVEILMRISRPNIAIREISVPLGLYSWRIWRLDLLEA